MCTCTTLGSPCTILILFFVIPYVSCVSVILYCVYILWTRRCIIMIVLLVNYDVSCFVGENWCYDITFLIWFCIYEKYPTLCCQCFVVLMLRDLVVGFRVVWLFLPPLPCWVLVGLIFDSSFSSFCCCCLSLLFVVAGYVLMTIYASWPPLEIDRAWFWDCSDWFFLITAITLTSFVVPYKLFSIFFDPPCCCSFCLMLSTCVVRSFRRPFSTAY